MKVVQITNPDNNDAYAYVWLSLNSDLDGVCWYNSYSGFENTGAPPVMRYMYR
jgi:hypothetical protein